MTHIAGRPRLICDHERQILDRIFRCSTSAPGR